MSLSVGDSLRMATLGWQSECALRNRADLAGGFFVPERCALPETAEECVELGRSMLRVYLAQPDAVQAASTPSNVVSGEISTVAIPADHVHTIDPDNSIAGCDGCDALKKKWREDQVAKERARIDRWAEKLTAKARHLQDINARPGLHDGRAHVAADLGLLAAFLVSDAIETASENVVTALSHIESRLDDIQDQIVYVGDSIHGDERE